MPTRLLHFPIDASLPELITAIRKKRNVVLSAPPGAGKTTRVPLALLDEPWLEDKKIMMLEPRRLAARRAAEFMSTQRAEHVGHTVGFRIRGDTAVSSSTRIEVLTEGILTRMVHQAPDLPGVGLLIFDEFHERSIHADLGLALALDVQDHLRDDLRILVMSATLDEVAVPRLLGDSATVLSAGKSYPVDTKYARFSSDKPVETRVADAVQRALLESEGDILVFLPGRREIMRTANLLADRRLSGDIHVHILHGDAPVREQSAALAPASADTRKVILSTSVAETSLTIDGVRVVIDSGLSRTARFDARRGMTGLVTLPVSKAAADQRRGRAGRQAPGICYRLWTEQEHQQLPDHPVPEIKSADLAPLALDLVRWGDPDALRLRFIDPPPAAHLAQAQSLLASLGAVNRSRQLTDHGRAIADLPLHPRLAHMVVRAKEHGIASTACLIAAMLEERDLLAGSDSGIDLRTRLHVMRTGRGADRHIRERILAQAKRIGELVGVRRSEQEAEEQAGILLALAYPDRIARRRDKHSTRYQMTNGMTAVLPSGSLLSREEYLAVGDVDGLGSEVRIFLAAPVSDTELFDFFQPDVETADDVRWDSARQCVVARRQLKLGAVILRDAPFVGEPSLLTAAMMEGIRQLGIDALPWTREAISLRQRSEWVRQHVQPTEGWPDLSDEQLIVSLDSWLAPSLGGIRKQEQLSTLSMTKILTSMFSSSQRVALERLAPSHFQLPSGTRAPLDYSAGAHPDLAVKLQELFGQTETPCIGGGHVPVRIHLLSPAGRPLAVTQDLRSFWATVYPRLRLQLRARYPKHPWPENPLTALPTGRPLPRRRH